MLLKYVVQVNGFGQPVIGSWVAFVHGWIYVIYAVTVFDLWSRMRWSFGRIVVLIAGGVIPVLSFVMATRAPGWVERRLQPLRPPEACVRRARPAPRPPPPARRATTHTPRQRTPPAPRPSPPARRATARMPRRRTPGDTCHIRARAEHRRRARCVSCEGDRPSSAPASARRRFRCSVRTTDRPPRAGGPGVLGDRPAHHAGGRHARQGSGRHHPL